MRVAIGLTLAFGFLACSAGSSDSTTSGGSATAGVGATGTTGGDTDGDGGGDSAGTTSGGISVTGTPIGMICDNLHHCHDAQACVSAGGTGGLSFCTIECGVSETTAKVPPDGGPQLCAEAQVMGNSATPACDLTMKEPRRYDAHLGLRPGVRNNLEGKELGRMPDRLDLLGQEHLSVTLSIGTSVAPSLRSESELDLNQR